jgi:hypothetical protein
MSPVSATRAGFRSWTAATTCSSKGPSCRKWVSEIWAIVKPFRVCGNPTTGTSTSWQSSASVVPPLLAWLAPGSAARAQIAMPARVRKRRRASGDMDTAEQGGVGKSEDWISNASPQRGTVRARPRTKEREEEERCAKANTKSWKGSSSLRLPAQKLASTQEGHSLLALGCCIHRPMGRILVLKKWPTPGRDSLRSAGEFTCSLHGDVPGRVPAGVCRTRLLPAVADGPDPDPSVGSKWS